MDKRIYFINSLLRTYDIARYELSDCYSKNKEFVDNAKKIFECKSDRDINLSLILIELVCPEISEELQTKLCRNIQLTCNGKNTPNELYKYRLLLITSMYYNPAFFVYAFNWCYFLELDDIHSNMIVYQFSSPVYYELGMTASGEKEEIKEIGKTITIENCGEFKITGHEENSIKITTFHFKFYNIEEKLVVKISYKVNNTESIIELKTENLKDGKSILRKSIENLDYEKGFFVNISIFKEE